MDGVPSSWRLSLVLPAFNEAGVVAAAVIEADEALTRLTAAHEILVVDDGSSDETAAIVTELARTRPAVRLLRHERNRGYGAALRTGFEAAQLERVAFTDSDCQFHLDDLRLLLELTDTRPIAVGYRIDRQDSWRRKFLSRGYNLLVRALLGTGVRDCDCALKVFRREALADLLPESSNFFVNTEMLARARMLGLDVAEAGVRHRPRPAGRSKVSLLDVPRTLGRLLPFWWMRVVFAGVVSRDAERSAAERGGSPRHGGTPRSAALRSASRLTNAESLALPLLLLIACLLFLTQLDAPLLEPQEPRHAEIARQMLVSGDWLTPTLSGEPYLDKPPLLYWLTAGSYALLGPCDWAARLVPGLAGVLTVLLTWFWGRHVAGPASAFWGALILTLSARFVYLGRMLTFDVLLCLCVTAALATAHLALHRPKLRWSWWLLSAGACGLGLLTKGPIALVLVLPPLAAFTFLDKRRPRLTLASLAAYLGLALLIAGPWYAIMIWRFPHFATYFFWTHNVVRFLAPLDHREPVWFHLPGLLFGLLPWSLLLPGLLLFLARRSVRTSTRRPAALGLFLLAWVWGLLFLSLSGCKRAGYVLPVIPPLALTLGCYLAQRLPLQRARVWLLRPSLLAGRASALSVVLCLGIVVLAWNNRLVGAQPAVGVASALLGLLLLLRLQPMRSWPTCAALTFVLLLGGVLLLLPSYNDQFALRQQLSVHWNLVRTGRVPVICWPQRWDSVSFYLPGAQVKVFGAGQRTELLGELQAHPESLLLLKSGRMLTDLLNELPGFAGADHATAARGGHGRLGPQPRHSGDGRDGGEVSQRWLLAGFLSHTLTVMIQGKQGTVADLNPANHNEA